MVVLIIIVLLIRCIFVRYEITAIPHASQATSKGRPPPPPPAARVRKLSDSDDDEDAYDVVAKGDPEEGPVELSTNAADLKMGVASFCKAFPWHFVIDRKMEIVQIGMNYLTFTITIFVALLISNS